MKWIRLIIIAILLGAVTPSCSIASPSPRHGPPLGPPTGYGDDRDHGDDRGYDDRGYDEYQLEWMDLRHPEDGFEIRILGSEKVWYSCDLRPSESFCYQLNHEPRLSGYVVPMARNVTIIHNTCPRGRSDYPGRVAAPG